MGNIHKSHIGRFKMSEKDKTHYNLAIPTETYRNLQKVAEQEGTTLADMLRRAIKWLFFLRTIKMDPEARLLIEQGGKTKEIIIDLVQFS
jgi:hypothetical protein